MMITPTIAIAMPMYSHVGSPVIELPGMMLAPCPAKTPPIARMITPTTIRNVRFMSPL